jgi:phosphatidylglycerophosphatase C
VSGGGGTVAGAGAVPGVAGCVAGAVPGVAGCAIGDAPAGAAVEFPGAASATAAEATENKIPAITTLPRATLFLLTTVRIQIRPFEPVSRSVPPTVPKMSARSLMQAAPDAIRYARTVERQTADEVWTRIEAAVRAEPGGVIATDGDGTLWTGDVGEDLFHAFLDLGRIEPSSDDAIRQTARDHALSDAGTALEVARRIYAAYFDGRFPEERVCELMVWCFAGWRRDEVRAFARAAVDKGSLAARLHREVLSVLDRARAGGIEVVLVSASPEVVVVEAGSRVGFAPGDVVAARPCFEGDCMLPGVHRPIPYGDGKVIRLREKVPANRPLYAAFGDNAFDVAMLASARVPVAVRPKVRLRDRAAAVHGLVELVPQ